MDVLTFPISGTKLSIPAEIGLPPASAPNLADGKRPVMFLMHGCDGLAPERNMIDLDAHWFREHGFITVTPDSFAPYNAFDVCVQQNVTPLKRFRDMLMIAAQLPGVEGLGADLGRLYAVGYSHGGAVMVEGALVQNMAPAGLPRFKGLISYYPDCERLRQAMTSVPVEGARLLVLVGAEDAMARAPLCQRAAEIAGDQANLRVRLYPGAVHGFNAPNYETAFDLAGGPYLIAGAIKFDLAAATAARQEVVDFLRTAGFTMEEAGKATPQ
jgi:dienelactone hydrolase